MSSLLASFEAQRQHRLPAAAQIKLATRDFHIIDWYINSTTVQRMAVIYDYDADQRVLDFLTALHFMHPNVRANVIGVAESQGRVTVWYGDKASLTDEGAGPALNEAVMAATWPTDKWICGRIILAPMRDNVLDRARLDPNSQLLAVPERFQLGLIEVRT
jgi:hypothetical protein